RHPVHRQKMAVVAAARGRAARTDWEVLGEIEIKGSAFSVVQCRLFTGRTHQIRVHMAHLGHGLLGDSVYGRKMFVERQMLHAWQLGFSHPRTGAWMQFNSPLPEDMRTLGVAFDGPRLG
ncbi:MAG: pseudouridine synthase, partial [Verrucomicrobiota bacterium]